MKRILFFGDSITDACRSMDNDQLTGIGYPTLVKATLSFEKPDCYEFFNRGISGNRVVDLLSRVKGDCINLNPDYISILIGVNDVWHEINWQNGVDEKRFEIIYDMLISQIKEALPKTKIMLLTPFVLEGPATCNTEESPNRLNLFKTGVAKRAEITEKLAQKYNLPCIELQSKFDELCNKAPNQCWLSDGVHPSAAGHKMIENEWIKAFKAL